MKKTIVCLLSWLIFLCGLNAQPATWHNETRTIHYQPDGQDFLTVNGTRRFNRALYGGNTAFRVEAGDLPEFALYLPGMGGNLQFGLIRGDKTKWLITADRIETRYRAGSMLYRITDSLLQGGEISISVLALYDQEGVIIKMEAGDVGSDLKLVVAYGGATGTKFSRDGDIGADPESSFYLKPEYCRSNTFRLQQNKFELLFSPKRILTEQQRYEIQNGQTTVQDSSYRDMRSISGVFPTGITLHEGDASGLQSPMTFLRSRVRDAAALAGLLSISPGQSYHFLVSNGVPTNISYEDLPPLFANAEKARRQVAERIVVNTPDPYINTLGAALAIAADAIWEDPSYLHGAVAWRMRLNGWRGAYAGDVLGWHDRARKHFSSYALSQLTSPATAPVVMDTALHLARGLEKLGTSLFSSGYIARNPNSDFRAHHYDMNLVFIDQLLNHFYWTGDTSYVRSMWPLLTRHLEWEKRNFDRDGDGLYDAYAAIWASDALQYSGGGVTHSSAYNYRSNRIAVQLARLLGEDDSIYEAEANRILKAMNAQLWLPKKGWFAEYKDLLGKKNVHAFAGLWTVYHAIDSRVPDAFQSYQLVKYVDRHIPKIPMRIQGLADTSLYMIATTNWQPYTWSLNNVALAEQMHTALSFWQAGQHEEAYRLWKSALVESMYAGASPGNIQQLSFYDAIRGELYRDFADGVGITSRALVEGLFGIMPDALHDTLHIAPGFPEAWDHASIHTPDIDFSFRRNGQTVEYQINNRIARASKLRLSVRACLDEVEWITVNGKKVKWSTDPYAVGLPILHVNTSAIGKVIVQIKWKGNKVVQSGKAIPYTEGSTLTFDQGSAEALKVYDPQEALMRPTIHNGQLRATVAPGDGMKTFFVQTKQGSFTAWMPVDILVQPPLALEAHRVNDSVFLQLQNNTGRELFANLSVNGKLNEKFVLPPGAQRRKFPVSSLSWMSGTNLLQVESGKWTATGMVIDWSFKNTAVKYEEVDLSSRYNDQLTNIFTNRYLHPRPTTTTLQLPVQGIGNWAYPLVQPVINDSGLKVRAGAQGRIVLQQQVPFRMASQFGSKNIAFTSQWDNYPDSLIIPLSGKASHAYLLMAGTTNAMQSRLVNGKVIVHYTDGTSDELELRNPENWWPIEQDYYEDGFAFTTSAPRPPRVYLKTGTDSMQSPEFITIRGFSNRGIDGGAATVLDMHLDISKQLKSIEIKSLANDVIIGLMSVTLVRMQQDSPR